MGKALWLYDKHKHLHTLPLQCRIMAMSTGSRLRRSETKRAAKHADVEPDEDGQFSGKGEHTVHRVQQRECIPGAHYKECDAHSFAQLL